MIITVYYDTNEPVNTWYDRNLVDSITVPTPDLIYPTNIKINNKEITVGFTDLSGKIYMPKNGRLEFSAD